MEYVYIRNHTRKWCTDEIDLFKYFKQYSQRVELFNIHPVRRPNKHSPMEYLQSVLKEANGLSKEEYDELRSATDPRQLNEILVDPTPESKDPFKSKEKTSQRKGANGRLHGRQQTPSTSKKGLVDIMSLPGAANNSTKSPSRPTFLCRKQKGLRRKNTKLREGEIPSLDLNIVSCARPGRKSIEEIYQTRNNRALKARLPRTDVLVMNTSSGGYKNMGPNQEYAVHFRIQDPFRCSGPGSLRPGRCGLEICVLGCQDLADLRDEILCEMDYQDIRGDVSNNPTEGVNKLFRDEYRSSMFYFGNTFYIDTREREMMDYSQGLRKWAAERDITLGETLPMTSTKISDLKLRFGYPYVFIHQGNCEHLVIVSSARLVSSGDCRCYEDYPMLIRMTHKNVVYCMLCSKYSIKWMVTNSERLLYDTTLLCESCFTRFNYIDGKKTENFKAYRYTQRGTLM